MNDALIARVQNDAASHEWAMNWCAAQVGDDIVSGDSHSLAPSTSSASQHLGQLGNTNGNTDPVPYDKGFMAWLKDACPGLADDLAETRRTYESLAEELGTIESETTDDPFIMLLKLYLSNSVVRVTLG